MYVSAVLSFRGIKMIVIMGFGILDLKIYFNVMIRVMSVIIKVVEVVGDNFVGVSD